MKNIILEVCRAGLYGCATYIYVHYPEIITGSVLFSFVLVMDMLIGVVKSRVLYSDQNPYRFSKKKMVIGFVSKLVYYSITLGAIAMSTFVYGESEIFNKTVIIVFLLCMFTGVLHNGVQISKKEELPERNAIAMVFEAGYLKIKSIIEGLVQKLTQP